ncbi:hypothetical protein FXO37_28837 [Capsicum annuum]|nr:hypothetical protein FXO37_28837 [Capsicum annuum]
MGDQMEKMKLRQNYANHWHTDLMRATESDPLYIHVVEAICLVAANVEKDIARNFAFARSLIACLTGSEEINDAAQILRCLSDVVYCTVCSCMQTQHKVEMDKRDGKFGPRPMAVPPAQQMSRLDQGYPPAQAYPPMQQPHGYPPQPHGYPPPQQQHQGYPPPQQQPQGYPPPQQQPQGYPPPQQQPQGYPPPQQQQPHGYPPVNYPPPDKEREVFDFDVYEEQELKGHNTRVEEWANMLKTKLNLEQKKELSRLTQGNSSVAAYFTKLKRLWDELDSLNSNIKCTCVCSCEGKQKLEKSLEDERLIVFLMSLNDTYAQARGNILMLNPLPDLNHSYSLILQDEDQRETYMSPLISTDSSSFMVGKFNQYKGRQVILKSVSNIFEPSSYKAASAYPGWKKAMEAEIEALKLNHTWDVVPIPQGRKALLCKWVYKVKQQADGTTERLKARLVIRGDIQKEGLDFNEKFPPEEVYIKFSAGVDPPSPNIVCRLKKSLYGLKQASRQWYARLAEALSDAQGEIANLKKFLHSEFHIKNLGTLHHFLGMEILREAQGIIVSQKKYTSDLLEEFDVSQLPSVSSPLDPTVKLTSTTSNLLDDPTSYRHLIGKLNYLIHSRSDLCHAVLILSQFMQQPSIHYYNAALRVVRYLKDFPNQGLFLSSSSLFSLNAFCDADWTSCRDSRRPISGFFISLGGCPISWKSKKQVSVSLFSAEGEYRSMRRLVAELTWLTRLLADLSVPPLLLVLVHSDSQAAIHIAKNPVFQEQTKHVELDCHFVRQQYLSGLISLSFVPSKDQLTDIFTKSLSGPAHHEILSKLGVTTLPSTLKRGVEIQPYSPFMASFLLRNYEQTKKEKSLTLMSTRSKS